MSLWQLLVTIEGWAEAHKQDEGGISNEEADDLWRWLQDKPLPSKAKANGKAADGNRT